jgi:LPXTG-motif cell wall-anchored protein
MSDIHVGDRVKVSYTTAGSTNTATDIEVVAAGSMPAGSTDYAQNDPMARTDDPDYRSDATNRHDPASGSAYDSSGQLPQTGSSLPLVGLVGLLLVGIGIAFRIVRMSAS